jgi:hypothetical protein
VIRLLKFIGLEAESLLFDTSDYGKTVKKQPKFVFAAPHQAQFLESLRNSLFGPVAISLAVAEDQIR